MAKWSSQEIETLTKMYLAGSSYKQIAEELSRPLTSINGKISALGLLAFNKDTSSISGEEWKYFHAVYQISNFGRVRNGKTKRILKISKNTVTGYYNIKLGGKTFRIHREVAKAFIPNPNNLPEVNHITGNLADNDTTSLEWVTRSENMIHAVETGLLPVLYGESAPNAVITEQTAKCICDAISKGYRNVDILNMYSTFGATKSIISKIRRRLIWTTISIEYDFN